MHRAFEVHRLNDRGMLKAQRLAQTFDTHLSLVREILGIQELGLTSQYIDRCEEHLELASFYAKKELATHPQNQDRGADVVQAPGLGGEATTEAPAPWPSKMVADVLFSVDTSLLQQELNRRARRKG